MTKELKGMRIKDEGRRGSVSRGRKGRTRETCAQGKDKKLFSFENAKSK